MEGDEVDVFVKKTFSELRWLPGTIVDDSDLENIKVQIKITEEPLVP